MKVMGFIMSAAAAVVTAVAWYMGDMEIALCGMWLAAGAAIPSVMGFVIGK